MNSYLTKSLPKVSSIPFLVILTLHISALTASSTPVPDATKPHATSGIKTRTRSSHVTTLVSGQIDMCLSCHNEKPDKAHGREVLGCYVCHKGNPLAGDVQRAHMGLIKNPGEFRYASETCGTTGCHPDEVARTKKSLMATNRGIISTLRYYWGEADNRNEDITIEKIRKQGLHSPAIDYFRKLCGTCHTGMEKDSLPGFLSEKGGGCTACHAVKPTGKDAAKGIYHIRMTRAVPSENCIRCHNRSGRIGLTYQGKYESEGYGTPYQDGDMSSMQLDDGRFYLRLHADIHQKAGMVCADCHTQKEIMGDGHEYAHLEQQVEISCETCHAGSETLHKIVQASKISYSTWKHEIDKFTEPRLNIVYKEGRYYLKGLVDSRLHPLDPPSPDNCEQPVHRRLSCQACHSTWVPQCYGCHVQYDRRQTQLDKLTLRQTSGKWTEFKSTLRFNSPPLGILNQQDKNANNDTGITGQEGKVVILVPG